MDEGGNWRAALVPAIALLVALATRSASAQTFAVGGGGGINIQRFDGDPDLNRLNGSSGSVFLHGRVAFGPFGAHVEGSWDTASTDENTTPLVVNGRSTTVLSRLTRSSRAVAVYGGYSYAISTGVRLEGLAGVSFLTVERGFNTNAGTVVLATPSSPVFSTDLTDQFTAWSAGANVLIASRRPDVRYVIGFRVEPLRLESEISGFRYRAQTGIEWSSK